MDKLHNVNVNIAQITWINYLNFGTFLQAFALQRIIKELGYNAKIIDDKRIVTNKIIRLKSCLIRIYNLVFRKNKNLRKRINLYSSFANKFLEIDSDWKNFSELNDRYENFICGSDQIWSSLLPDDFGGFYFASFANEDKKKIAYAPSLGSSTYSEEYAKRVEPWLHNFIYLSSREKTGLEILSRITKRSDIRVVLDPTLLLSSDEWANFVKENGNDSLFNVKKPYMLAYFLTANETYAAKAREIANNLGLALVMFDNLDWNWNHSDYIAIGGPMEFLTAIYNAQFVITDSFHGSIFSIHFRRPFLTVQRFKHNDKNNQNSRITNLFEMLNITDFFRNEDNLENLPMIPNWNAIEDILKVEREKSIEYLKNSLL